MLAITRFLPIAAAFTTALTLACDTEVDAVDADVSLRDGPGSGMPPLNTFKLYDSEINAVDTHDQLLGAVRLMDVELFNGVGYSSIDDDSLTVDHGKLHATLNGIPKNGLQFEGSRWTYRVGIKQVIGYLTDIETADDGGLWDPTSTLDLRRLDPERDVYTFHYYQNGHPIDTCDTDATGGSRAVIYGDILVNNSNGNIVQRPNTVYIACLSGAVGKAALWGYAPDSPSLTSVPLPAFATAVRKVRADYCGDGTSYTEIGNPVTMRDSFGIHDFSDFSVANFATEAVWEGGGGAVCVNRIRSTGANLLAPLTCADGSQIPLCGANASVETLWNNNDYAFWSKIEP